MWVFSPQHHDALSNQPYSILNCSGLYGTAVGRDVPCSVVPSEGVEGGERFFVSMSRGLRATLAQK